MKNIIYICLITLIVACSSDELTTKKAELAELKKQESEIKSKISTIEKDIAKLIGKKVTNAQLVGITKIAKSSFSHYIDVQAKVDGDENVTVNSQVPGAVTKINVTAIIEEKQIIPGRIPNVNINTTKHPIITSK